MFCDIKFLLLFTIIFGCFKTEAQTWEIFGGAGISAAAVWYPSIAIDNRGTPYVVFLDFDTWDYNATVKKYNGSSWETVGLPGFSAGWVDYTSIAIDRSGMPYVTYKDNSYDSKATVMK
jgi:hypothetical protein